MVALVEPMFMLVRRHLLHTNTGDLWWCSDPDDLTLYVYDGSIWAPAAPPVSLDGIEKDIEFLGDISKAFNEQIGALNRATVDQQQRLNSIEASVGDAVTHKEFDDSQAIQNSRLDDLEAGQIVQDDQIKDLEDEQKLQSDQISENTADIAELKVVKGTAARYTVKEIGMTPASRNGELVVDNADPSLVTFVSFAPFDEVGNPTKPISEGDILEFVEAAATTKAVGDVTRYIVDAVATPQALTVKFVNGNNDFVVDEIEEVYIYPQSKNSVSEDYVDAQDELRVLKAGDEMRGKLIINNGSGVNTALEIKAYDGSMPGKRRTSFELGADGKIKGDSLKFSSSVDANVSYSLTDAHYFKGVLRGSDASGNVIFKVGGTNVDYYLRARSTEGFVVKGSGQSISGTNVFEALPITPLIAVGLIHRNHITNKKYVDDAIAASGGSATDKVSKKGDTMTGALKMEGYETKYLWDDKNTAITVHASGPDTGLIHVLEKCNFGMFGYLNDVAKTQGHFLFWEKSQGLKLRWLVDPSDDRMAISRGYANKSYLQLSGGTIYWSHFLQRTS